MKIHFLILSLCVIISVNAYTPPNAHKTIFDDKTVCYRNLRYGVIPDAIPDSTCDRILDLYIPEMTENSEALPIYFLFTEVDLQEETRKLNWLCFKNCKCRICRCVDQLPINIEIQQP